MSWDSSSRNRGREFDFSEPVDSFANTVRRILLSPRNFFGGIALGGNLKNPLVFGIACLVVSSLLGGLINYLNVPGVASWVTVNSPAEGLRGLDTGVGDIVAFGLFGVLLAPLWALLQLCIFSAFVHLLVTIFMQRRRNFEATLRVYCYASTVALLNWLPLVGWVATLYGLYVLVVGLQEVHARSSEAVTAQG